MNSSKIFSTNLNNHTIFLRLLRNKRTLPHRWIIHNHQIVRLVISCIFSGTRHGETFVCAFRRSHDCRTACRMQDNCDGLSSHDLQLVVTAFVSMSERTPLHTECWRHVHWYHRVVNRCSFDCRCTFLICAQLVPFNLDLRLYDSTWHFRSV